jgi:hypothetical protein
MPVSEQVASVTPASDGVVVASCSMAELFCGKSILASDGSTVEGKLHLPEYQRPYRWTSSELNRLVDDLLHYFSESERTHQFFLGSVILHQQHDNELLNIIDGQQRITTMGLLAWLQNPGTEPDLTYASPLSQQRIRENLRWLHEQKALLVRLDLSRINVVVVVTRSEDDAYRFFETQNTGGVRLKGPDIIKAHHLRSIIGGQQDLYAKVWERLGDLTPIVDALLKARYWQVLSFRSLPSRRQPQQIKMAVVDELADKTGSESADIAFRPLAVIHDETGRLQQSADVNGYAARQPLNAGVNSVNYLKYFETLRQQLLTDHCVVGQEPFHDFYKGLVCKVEGCAYLKELYDSCLLVYVSHFGSHQLYEAALWLFRAVYSRRVTNQKTVKERSVGAFIKDSPLYDWMLMAYSHQQFIDRLMAFKIEVTSENLGEEEKSVKKRFILKVNDWFKLEVDKAHLAETYDVALISGIKRKFDSKGSELC